MNFKLLLTSLFGMFAIFSSAQDCHYSLKGSVIDYHSKTTLPGATISVVGQNRAVISDLNGSFVLSGLCEGRLELEVFHPECPTQFIPVEISGDTELTVKLEHHLEELDEVKVVGSTISEQTNSANEKTINQDVLDQYSSKSLGDALKEVSGVSSLNTGSNIVKPTIHGLNGSRVLILNDGVRMQDMEWGDEHAPNLDINSAGSISVVKGAAALQYGGDAIGGTVVLDPGRIPQIDTLYGKTLLTGVTNGRGGTLVSELVKAYKNGWFVKGQASYKRLGDAEAPDYTLSNTGVQELAGSFQLGKHLFTWGWDARYSYFNSEIAILRASHIGNIDDLIRSINSGEPETIDDFTYDLENPKQEVTHHLAKVKFYRRFEGLGKWNVQYDFQSNRRFEFDLRRGDRSEIPSIDLELTTHTISTDLKIDAKDQWKWHFGLLGRYQDNFANPDTGVRRLIPDYEKLDFGLFVTGEWNLNENMVLDAGIRYDYNKIDAQKFYQKTRWEERGYDDHYSDLIVSDRGTQYLVNPKFDFGNVTATLGANYKIEKGSLRANYTMAQRAPNPAELFSDGLHHSAARIELGDLSIESETSHKISASFEKDYDNWGFGFEPFANFVDDFILLQPTGVEFTLRGAFPVWEYSQTDVRLFGFDTSLYANWLPSFTSEHSFSLVKGRDIENENALINVPSARTVHQITYRNKEWKQLEVSLESQYVFKQNETPDNITVFSPEQQQEVALLINNAPAAYHLLSFNTKMKFPLGGKTMLTPSLTINNLFNTSYRDYLNRQRYFADDLGRNITLQLKINY